MHANDVAPAMAPARPAPSDTATSRPWRLVWALLFAGLIFYASDRAVVGGVGGVRVNDKLAHFLAYGLLATLVCRAMGSGWRGALVAVVAASAYGASDEWHQSFVPGRSCELADWVADTLGAAVAVFLYRAWAPYRRILEAPLFRRNQA